MEETKTNLRQAEATVSVTGILSEKNLEMKTEDGKTYISGYLTIKTSDTNFVRINTRVNEKTQTGTDNKAYAGIVTVMNEYKSIADVGEDAADRVGVRGNLNLYTDKNGKANVNYQSNFFNRIQNMDNYAPHAEFEVEMFISSMVPETDKEQEETGRLIVHGWVPTYNGIEPITMIAYKNEDGDIIAGDIENAFEPGQTVKFFGQIVNSKVEKITEIPVKIGKPRREVKTTYVNELLITGASEAYEEGVTLEKPYEKETIQAAIQERKNKLEEQKSKANNVSQPKAAATPSGASRGRTLGF